MRKLLAFGIVTLLAASASADPAAREDCAPRVGPAKFHVEKINGKDTWVTDDPIQICGHPAKPAVAIIDTARVIQYRWLDLEEQMLPKILETTKQKPMK